MPGLSRVLVATSGPVIAAISATGAPPLGRRPGTEVVGGGAAAAREGVRQAGPPPRGFQTVPLRHPDPTAPRPALAQARRCTVSVPPPPRTARAARRATLYVSRSCA